MIKNKFFAGAILSIAIGFAPFFAFADTIEDLQSRVRILNSQIEELQSQIQTLNNRITALRQNAQQPTVTFSPDGGTLVGGTGSWTFTLNNAQTYSVLSVKAWKDDTFLGTFEICNTYSSGSCTKTRLVPASNAGTWKGEVFVNGVAIGKTINFRVSAPEGGGSTPPSPQPVTGTSFNFSQNGKTMVAGQDSWVLNVYGLQPGDEVNMNTWKDGGALHNFLICRVTTVINFPSTSCGARGQATDADIGSWVGELGLTRNGVDTVIANKGAIAFNVVRYVAPPTPVPGESCGLSVSAAGTIPVGTQETVTVVSNPPYQGFKWCGSDTTNGVTTVVREPDGTLCKPGGTSNQSYSYTLNTPGVLYTRYAIVSLPGGPCTTNTIRINVQSQTSSIQPPNTASAYNAIKKQLDKFFAPTLR